MSRNADGERSDAQLDQYRLAVSSERMMAFDVTMAVARGDYDDVPGIARALEPLIRTV